MNQQPQNNGNGMRISAHILENVCKRMIEVILFCLPHAIRGTIYAVGPIPELRVTHIASGDKDQGSEHIMWDVKARSDYDPPGKLWEEYRDRPDVILEAMS